MDYYYIWSIRKIFLGTAAVLSLLSSCNLPPSTTPIPSVQFIDLYYPPSLDFLRADISSCISSLDSFVPYLHEQSARYSSLKSGAIILQLGEMKWDEIDYFVTQIDSQNIIFVINVVNPMESINIKEIKDIFSGQQSVWTDEDLVGKKITVWIYPDGSDLKEWLKDKFIGTSRIAPTSKLAPNPGSVLEAVSKNAAAIGYVPEGWMEFVNPNIKRSIKEIYLENNTEDLISLPVLAYLREEPFGDTRNFLSCLQDQSKQR